MIERLHEVISDLTTEHESLLESISVIVFYDRVVFDFTFQILSHQWVIIFA